MNDPRIRRIAVGPLETNCYIILENDLCLVIDPGDDAGLIMEEIDLRRRQVQAILLTHAHFDHTGAAAELQERTGARVMVGVGDEGLLRDPGWMKQFMRPKADIPSDIGVLREGEEVALGATTLKVWETPGHSPGSLSYVVAPGEGPGMVFSGDLIFRRGTGRTDLPGGDYNLLVESIGRVLALPGDTMIYPGHGPFTTVDRER